eukprot:2255213-Rhodomonas_salina.1
MPLSRVAPTMISAIMLLPEFYVALVQFYTAENQRTYKELYVTIVLYKLLLQQSHRQSCRRIDCRIDRNVFTYAVKWCVHVFKSCKFLFLSLFVTQSGLSKDLDNLKSVGRSPRIRDRGRARSLGERAGLSRSDSQCVTLRYSYPGTRSQSHVPKEGSKGSCVSAYPIQLYPGTRYRLALRE